MKSLVVIILSLTILLSIAIPIIYLIICFVFNCRENKKECWFELMKDINIVGKLNKEQ